MLSNKNTKRKNNEKNKRTKKRTNIKNNRKYRNNRNNRNNKSLIGGAGKTVRQQEETYKLVGFIEGQDKSSFDHPTGIAISGKYHIYVADTRNKRIQIFDGNTNPITYLGTIKKSIDKISLEKPKKLDDNNIDKPKLVNDDKNYLDLFMRPDSVAFSDTDNLIYVTDSLKNQVQVFDSDALEYIKYNKTKPANTFGSSGVSKHLIEFREPIGIAVSPDGKLIYVADLLNNRVQVLERKKTENKSLSFFEQKKYDYQWLETLGTNLSGGNSNEEFNKPCAVAVSKDRIFVVDRDNNRVQIFTVGTNIDRNTIKLGIRLSRKKHSNYTYSATLGTGKNGDVNDKFDYPSSIAVSPSGDRIYVVDKLLNKRIKVFNGITLKYITTFNNTDPDPFNLLRIPEGIAVSPDGNRIYVVDTMTDNNHVKIYEKYPLNELEPGFTHKRHSRQSSKSRTSRQLNHSKI